MSYKTTFQGIPIETNVPIDIPHPPGSIYEFTIKMNQPLAKIITDFYSHVKKWADEFITKMSKQGHKISNLEVSALDDYTLYIKMVASSPALAVVLPWVLRIATIGTIGGMIWGITATVTSPTAAAPLAEIKNIVLYLVLGGLGVIAGLIAYKIVSAKYK